MTRVRLDRQRALAELREILWEWDPLNLASERDALADEYDGQAERTLRILRDDGDTAAVGADLSAWLDRSTPPGWRGHDRGAIDRQARGLDEWWQGFTDRPLEPGEPPFWGAPWVGGLILVWLAVTGASIALGLDQLPDLLSGGIVALAPSVTGVAFAALPAAVILGAPRVASENVALLAGSVFLVLSKGIPGLLGRLHRISTPDVFEDLDRFRLIQDAISVLGLALALAGAYLLILGLRRLDADSRRWLAPTLVLVAVLGSSSYVAAVLAYGQPWLDWVAANVPAVLWALTVWSVGLVATAALFVFAVAGARAGLPRTAWLLAAIGFGASLLAPVATSLGFVVSQAAPDLAGIWVVGYALGRVADIAIPTAFLVGLGGGGATPPWIPWLRGRWRLLREQGVGPA